MSEQVEALPVARKRVTRREHLRLLAWHLRVAWDHLKAMVKYNQ